MDSYSYFLCNEIISFIKIIDESVLKELARFKFESMIPPVSLTKVYSFLNQQKVKGIEIAPKLLLHDITDIFKLNKKEL